jgi:hypothetical protein
MVSFERTDIIQVFIRLEMLAAAIGKPLQLSDAIPLKETTVDQNLRRSPHVHVVLTDMF